MDYSTEAISRADTVTRRHERQRPGNCVTGDLFTKQRKAGRAKRGQGASQHRPADRPAPGLSTTHISPKPSAPFELITHLGGTFTKLKGTGRPGNGGGKRRAIGGFSHGSRQRLQRKMASINEPEVYAHRSLVTLTYPGQYPACGREWKRHLDVFLKRLMRTYDVQAVVWKLEPQKRGAPHYHLLVFSADTLDRQWVAHAWHEVVGSGRPEHLRAGTQCDPIRSWRGVLCYASKYLGKVVEERLPDYWIGAGRWWGVRGKLPIEAITQALTREEGVKVRRVIRRYLSAKFGRRMKVYGALNGLAAFMSDQDALRLVGWVMESTSEYAPMIAAYA